MYKFKATIRIIGINPFVEIPHAILQKIFHDAAKEKGPIPVHGTINGHPFTQTLVKYKDLWRLYLNTPMRQASSTTVGDTATFEIAFDPQPRKEPVNKYLTQALTTNQFANIAFDQLPSYRRKEINRYLNGLKSEEKIRENIDKIIRHLEGEEVDSILFYQRKSKQSS